MKVWDLHCDTLYELRRAEKAGAPKSFLHNDLHIDLEKLQQGDYLLQCFAAYVDLADPAPGGRPAGKRAGGDRHLQAAHGSLPGKDRPGVHRRRP